MSWLSRSVKTSEQAHAAVRWTFWLGLGWVLLGLVPAWALATYPGWWVTTEGYFPYFNVLAWVETPRWWWRPPYLLADTGGPWPVPEGIIGLGVWGGLDPLTALRWSVVVALVGGAVGLYVLWFPVVGSWPAVAAALLWAYAPYTLGLAYRLGHVRELWAWSVVPWLLLFLRPRWTRWAWQRVVRWSWPLTLAAWLPAAAPEWAFGAAPGIQSLSPWWGGLTLAGIPFVAWAVSRLGLGVSLYVFGLTAFGALLVVPAVRPTYLAYLPPSEPKAVFHSREIVLLDVEVEGVLRPGERVRVSAYWQVLRSQRTDWTVFTQVLGPENRIWGQFDGPVGGVEHPMSRWWEGEMRGEVYQLTIAADAPPSLRLIMGLYNRETMQRLPLLDGRDHVVVAVTP